MPQRRDTLLLLTALLLSIAGAWGHFTLPLDLRNQAMKSRTGADAEAQAARERDFGSDDAIVVMIEPRGSAVTGAPESAEVSDWLASLRASPELGAVQVLPSSGPAATLVALRLARGGAPLGELLGRLRAGAPPTHRLSITGQPVGELAIARALAAEQARIVPAILVALGALLLLVYRRLSLVLAALLPGLGAILWLGGIERSLGLAIDPVSTLLAPVVLTVGVAGAVHVLEAYLRELADGVPPSAAAGLAIRHMARPLLLTSTTTAAGFLSLTVGSIPAVRRFGLLAALGVGLATLWIVLLVPAWLRRSASVARHVARARRRVLGELGRELAPLYVGRVERSAPLLCVLSAGAALFFAWHGARVLTDTEPVRVLPADHPFRVASARIQARLGGDEVFELYLPQPHPPLAPLATAQLAARVAADPLVAMLTGAPRAAPSGALLLGALLRPSGTAERGELFARAEEAARELGFVHAHATGPAVQVARDSQALVRDQRLGLAAMCVLLWALMAIGLRSARLATLGLVPNVLPCLVLYGGLELAGRPLSVATAMIATVLLGLIVDNTIHLLHGYASARSAERDPRSAVEAAIARSSRAVLTTSLVLALGFGAALRGRLETTREFALLAAATILVALLCDLIVLPALLLLHTRRSATSTPSIAGEPGPCVEITT